MKKFFFVLLSLFIIPISPKVQAAATSEASIIRFIIADASGYVQVHAPTKNRHCGIFRDFRINPNDIGARSMLATLLTAHALQKQVRLTTRDCNELSPGDIPELLAVQLTGISY